MVYPNIWVHLAQELRFQKQTNETDCEAMRCSGEPHGRNVETDPAWLKLIEARSHINFFILWVDKAGRVPTMTFSADIFCSKTASLAMAVQHKDSVALDIDSTVPGYFH